MKYIAELTNAREVSLLCTGDAGPWGAELEQVGLYPYRGERRTTLIVSATAATWKGQRFRELAVGMAACRRKSGATLDGYYLACAFHSSRLLGWFERNLFKTPHRHAEVAVSEALPVSIGARLGAVSLITASMGQPRTPIREQDEGWELPVFLPHRKPTSARKRNLFRARIGGATRVFPFEGDSDSLTFGTESGSSALQRLGQSSVAGFEWHIRSNAHHARSRTYSEDFD